MSTVCAWVFTRSLVGKQPQGPSCISLRMIDNALKYNLGFCFRRKDAKGVNASELCFSGRHQNVATERTAEYGSLIGLQIPLPYLKSSLV